MAGAYVVSSSSWASASEDRDGNDSPEENASMTKLSKTIRERALMRCNIDYSYCDVGEGFKFAVQTEFRLS